MLLVYLGSPTSQKLPPLRSLQFSGSTTSMAMAWTPGTWDLGPPHALEKREVPFL